MLKNKKAQDLQNRIQIHIAKLNSEIRTKKNFRDGQVASFKNKYNSRINDLTFQFENILRAEVCIEKATQAQNYLQLLFRCTELLVDSKPLPDDIQTALEFCFYFSKIDKQKDLFYLLSELTRTHTFRKRICQTHETKVYFNSEQVTLDDAKRFYPAIKKECLLQEDKYLYNALSKYNCIFNDSENQTNTAFTFPPNSVSQSQTSTQNIPQNVTQTMQLSQQNEVNQQLSRQNSAQNIQCSQTLNQPPVFTPVNLSQPPRFSPQNSMQNIQLTQGMNQQPTFTPVNLSQPPRFSPQNSMQNIKLTQDMNSQPTFTPLDMSQTPCFSPHNSMQNIQLTQGMSQQSTFTPVNLSPQYGSMPNIQLPQPNVSQTPQYRQQNYEQQYAGQPLYQQPEYNSDIMGQVQYPVFAPPDFEEMNDENVKAKVQFDEEEEEDVNQ